MATCNVWNSDNDLSKSLKAVCTETNKQTKLWYLVIIPREKKKNKQMLQTVTSKFQEKKFQLSNSWTQFDLTRCTGQETFFLFFMDFHGKLTELLKGIDLLAAIYVWYSLFLSLAYEIWSSLSWLLSLLKGKMHIGQMFYGNLHKKWWQRAINSSLLCSEMLLCS